MCVALLQNLFTILEIHVAAFSCITGHSASQTERSISSFITPSSDRTAIICNIIRQSGAAKLLCYYPLMLGWVGVSILQHKFSILHLSYPQCTGDFILWKIPDIDCTGRFHDDLWCPANCTMMLYNG